MLVAMDLPQNFLCTHANPVYHAEVWMHCSSPSICTMWLEVSSLSSAHISEVSNHWKTTATFLVAFPRLKKPLVSEKASWAVHTETRAKQSQWDWLVWVLEVTCMHKTKGNNTKVTQLPFPYYGFKGKPCMHQREKDGCG